MFTATDGVPKTEIVYDLMAAVEPGAIVTYGAMEDALGFDVRDGRRSIVSKAIRRLEVRNLRTAEAVPTVGYRVVDAFEHERLSALHNRKAIRQVRRARQRIESADGARLTPELRARFAQIGIVLARVESEQRATARRLARLEGVLIEEFARSLQPAGGASSLDDRVARLERALERLGQAATKNS
jgi:alkylated DNA nucleotide flippase Atl1